MARATFASHGSGDGAMENDATQSAIEPAGGVLPPVVYVTAIVRIEKDTVDARGGVIRC